MTYFMVVSRLDFPLYEFELAAPVKARTGCARVALLRSR
jgi:hypothetical protein